MKLTTANSRRTMKENQPRWLLVLLMLLEDSWRSGDLGLITVSHLQDHRITWFMDPTTTMWPRATWSRPRRMQSARRLWDVAVGLAGLAVVGGGIGRNSPPHNWQRWRRYSKRHIIQTATAERSWRERSIWRKLGCRWVELFWFFDSFSCR